MPNINEKKQLTAVALIDIGAWSEFAMVARRTAVHEMTWYASAVCVTVIMF